MLTGIEARCTKEKASVARSLAGGSATEAVVGRRGGLLVKQAGFLSVPLGFDPPPLHLPNSFRLGLGFSDPRLRRG